MVYYQFANVILPLLSGVWALTTRYPRLFFACRHILESQLWKGFIMRLLAVSLRSSVGSVWKHQRNYLGGGG